MSLKRRFAVSASAHVNSVKIHRRCEARVPVVWDEATLGHCVVRRVLRSTIRGRCGCQKNCLSPCQSVEREGEPTLMRLPTIPDSPRAPQWLCARPRCAARASPGKFPAAQNPRTKLAKLFPDVPRPAQKSSPVRGKPNANRTRESAVRTLRNRVRLSIQSAEQELPRGFQQNDQSCDCDCLVAFQAPPPKVLANCDGAPDFLQSLHA